VRLYSIVRLARNIQMELIRYKTAVVEDSEYEEDDTAYEKYKGNHY